MLKKELLILFLVMTGVTIAQNDSINEDRYEAINAIYTDFNIEKHGQIILDRNFFPFLGLGSLISDGKLIENLIGHCGDFKTKEEYSFSDILSEKEISEMHNQISDFRNFKRIDPKRISEKIILKKDPENNYTAITLPLVYNNKAVVYRTNKDNEETLFVLVKTNGEWKVKCVKYLYIRFDD